MGSSPDSDLFPTQTYRDPLLFPLYIRTNDTRAIYEQVHGDWLLAAFVNGLDQEIVDDIPEFAEYKEICVQIMDACRTFGWCVFQQYKGPTEEEPEINKVFTPLERTDWIKELNPITNKQERVGIKVKWTDDLGNTQEDSLYFDDRVEPNPDPLKPSTLIGKAYFIVWKKGNGQPLANSPWDSAWAIADVNNAVLSIAIQIRQIQSALTFSATNPYFYHFKYGDGITPAQRTELMNQMQYVNTTTGIGAKTQVLQEIISIENSATEKTILALDQMVSFFASCTRLPLSYFLGEKQTGGLGDTGEQTDEVKIAQKKQFILGHFTSYFSEIFGLPDLSSYYTDKMEEEKQHQEDLQQQQNQPAKAESK